MMQRAMAVGSAIPGVATNALVQVPQHATAFKDFTVRFKTLLGTLSSGPLDNAHAALSCLLWPLSSSL